MRLKDNWKADDTDGEDKTDFIYKLNPQYPLYPRSHLTHLYLHSYNCMDNANNYCRSNNPGQDGIVR
jgi:hypothetical protein